jgi:hypothetical protein
MDDCNGTGNETNVQQLETLDREARALRELLDVEPNSKWCMLTLARLAEAQHAHATSENATIAVEEAKRLYSKLTILVRCAAGMFLECSLFVPGMSPECSQNVPCRGDLSIEAGFP